MLISVLREITTRWRMMRVRGTEMRTTPSIAACLRIGMASDADRILALYRYQPPTPLPPYQYPEGREMREPPTRSVGSDAE